MPEIAELRERIKILENALEKERKASAEKGKILDLSQNLICIASQDGYLKYVNPAWEKVLGYSQKELLSNPFLTFIHPDDHQKNNCEVERLSRGELSIDFENRFIHKNGSILTISWTATPDVQKESFYCIGRNVTRERKAEKAFQKSQNKLQQIMDHANEMYYIHDTSHQLSYVSPACQNIFGYTPEEMRVKWTTLVTDHPMNKKGLELTEKAIQTGKRQQVYTLEILRKDGEKRIIEVYESPIIDDKNKVTGIAGAIRDVTVQTKAIASLKESQERFQILFEDGPDALYLIDMKGRFVDGNKAAERLTGYKREELIGKSFKQSGLLASDHLKKTLGILARHIAGKRSGTDELVLLRKDGKPVLVEVTGHTIRMQGKKVILGTARDITAKKEAEVAALSEHERAQQYFHLAGVMFVAIDSNQTVTMINKKGCEILGYSEKEIIGKNWFDSFIPKAQRDEVRAVFEKIMKGRIQPVEYYENLVLTKNQGERLIAWHNTLIKDDDGHIVSSLSSGEDITNRKQADQTIQKSLEEKEILLKEIHHRVKNNLQIIISLLNLQSYRIQDKEARQAFENSKQRVYSMALVHEKLYRSQNFANIQFDDYVKTMTTEIIRASADFGRIRLDLQIEPIELSIDLAIPFGLIINELMTNAIKYAFPDGTEGKIQIGFHSRKNQYTLTVMDNGIGLPDDVYFQKKGSLGMQLVHILTEQIGGSIEISREGGTRFTIQIDSPKIKR